MRKILFKIAMNRRAKIISEGTKPYLERYFLFAFLGLRFYLHRFINSDPERGLHDHPWRWAFSIILIGKYFEMLVDDGRVVRWFNFIRGNTFHRVILRDDECFMVDEETLTYRKKEVWTLFIHPEKYSKDWGFLRYVDGVLKYFKWEPRHRDESGEKTEWEKTAPLGKDFPRDVYGVAIVEN